MSEAVKKIADIARPVFEKYGVKSAGLFGSQARGDATEKSDIDILLSFGADPMTLFDVIRMKNELNDLLKKTVDLVTDKSVSPYFRESIYKDLTNIYEG